VVALAVPFQSAVMPALSRAAFWQRIKDKSI
jgi:hypothetical protein